MKKILFHGSEIADIQVLKAWSRLHNTNEKVVYLSGNLPYALLYIWDSIKHECDRKHITAGVKNGVVLYEEQFPNQLEVFYKGAKGYLYCVEKKEEMGAVEDHENMYYSLKDVPVGECIYIDDVYKELIKYEKEGKLKVCRFLEAEKAKQKELTKRIVEYIMKKELLHTESDVARFFKRNFKASWELAEKMESR